MPIYKTGDKKDALTKYKVRVNYTDDSGKAHSLTRVAYGLDAAKTLEAKTPSIVNLKNLGVN